MPRKTRSKIPASIGQDVKSVNAEIKRLNKQSKELLRKAGKDIRQVRSEVSKLKKLGIVSQRIDARTYVPTKYMLSKLRKNADVLIGNSIAVKAPKDVIKKYVEKGLFEKRGKALIVPKDRADQKVKIARGLVEIATPLKNGEMVKVILPFKMTDMENVANRLIEDPTLDGLKNGNEMFGFTLFGHNMNTMGFVDAQEFGEYVLRNYRHIFSQSNKANGEAVKEFILTRFKSMDGMMPYEGPQELKRYSKPLKPQTERDWYFQRQLAVKAAKKRASRAKETPAQREKRLDKQRLRTAQNRQKKFDES